MDKLYCLLKTYLELVDLTFKCLCCLCRSLMENKLKTGTTLIVDRYSYSGVAFSSAKGLDIEWCKVKYLQWFFFLLAKKN